MIPWMMIEAAFEKPEWIIVFPSILAALLVVLGYHISRNVAVYDLSEPGYAFKPIARYRITIKSMTVDLTRLRECPENWALEIKPRTAVKFKGKDLTIHTRERGDVVHQITGLDSFGAYWFSAPPDAEDGDWA